MFPDLTVLRLGGQQRRDFQLPQDTYVGWVLLAPEEGAFRYTVSGPDCQETGEARFGDLLLCPPGHLLRRRAISPPISFQFAEFRTVEALKSGKVSVLDTARLSSTFAACHRYRGNTHRSVQVHLVRDFLFLAWDAWQQSDKVGRPADLSVQEAVALFEARLGESDLSLAAVAQAVSLSPVQLTRRFRVALGVTPSEYLAGLRLLEVERRLRETSEPLAEIAEACGYRDAFYLSRVFLKKRGVRPSVYRRLGRV
jgi:AraC family transcriptional regulator